MEYRLSMRCNWACRQLGEQPRIPTKAPAVHSLDCVETGGHIRFGKPALLELASVQVKIRNGQAETLRNHRFRHVASIGNASGPTHGYAFRLVRLGGALGIRRGAEF